MAGERTGPGPLKVTIGGPRRELGDKEGVLPEPQPEPLDDPLFQITELASDAFIERREETRERSMLDVVGDLVRSTGGAIVRDVRDKPGEVLLSPLSGATDAGSAIWNALGLGEEIAALEEALDGIPVLGARSPEQTTTTGNVVAEISQFGAGAAALVPGLGALGVPRLLAWAIGGGFAGSVATDPGRENIADMLSQLNFSNEQAEFYRKLYVDALAKGQTDSEFEKRLRGGIEEFAIGGLADTAIKAGVALFRVGRKAASSATIDNMHQIGEQGTRELEALAQIERNTVQLHAGLPVDERVVTARLKQTIGKTADLLERFRDTVGGRLVEDVRGLTPRGARNRLHKAAIQLALEGAPGRFWYEQSAREVMQFVGHDVELADKFAQLLAIYSPRTAVDQNMQAAIKAWNQWRRGDPIRAGTADRNANATNVLYNDIPFEGRKTNNFWTNIMFELDPQRVQGVTADMWMAHAFGFVVPEVPSDSAKYAFIEQMTKALADDLALQGKHWEPHQIQAAIWTATKVRFEAKRLQAKALAFKNGWLKKVDVADGKVKEAFGGDTAAARQRSQDQFATAWRKLAMKQEAGDLDFEAVGEQDFGFFLRQQSARVSWEAAPGSDIGGHFPEHAAAPPEVQTEYFRAMAQALTDDEGVDLIAQKLGLLSPGEVEAPGYFRTSTGEDVFNPSGQTSIATVRLPSNERVAGRALKVQTGVDAQGEPIFVERPTQAAAAQLRTEEEKLIRLYAAMRGLALKQDTVGWHRPTWVGMARESEGGVLVDLGRTPTADEIVAIREQLEVAFEGTTMTMENVAVVADDQGMRLLHVPSFVEDGQKLEVANTVFQDIVFKAAGEALPDANSAVSFGYAGDLAFGGWDNGLPKEYLAEISASRSPDLQRWFQDTLLPRSRQVEASFEERFGWTPNGEIDDKVDAWFAQQRGRGEVATGSTRGLPLGAVAIGPAAAPLAIIRDDPAAADVQVASAASSVLGSFLRRNLKMGAKAATDRAASATDQIAARSMREGSYDELLARKYGISPSVSERFEGLDFNFENINAPDDVKRLIDDVSEVLEPEITAHKRGVRSHRQTELDASLLNMDIDDIFDMKGIKPEEMLKARHLMVGLASKVRASAVKARDGDMEAMVEMRQLLDLYSAVQTHVKGLQTETARTLSAMRVSARDTADIDAAVEATRRPAGTAVGDLDEMVGAYGGIDTNRRIANVIASHEDPVEALRAMGQVNRATGWQMFYEMWINGLLSGPFTHVVNFGTSFGAVTLNTPETMVAGLIGMTQRAMRGSTRGGVEIGEVIPQMHGLLEGLHLGSRNALKVMMTGEPSDLVTKFEGGNRMRRITAANVARLPGVRNLGPVRAALEGSGWTARGFDLLADWTVRLPQRVMFTADEFNKGLAYASAIRGAASRKAIQEAPPSREATRKRYRELVADAKSGAIGTEDLQDEAFAHARYTTFQNELARESSISPSRLPSVGLALQNFLQAVPASRIIIPFLKTPINLVDFTVERTPAALATPRFWRTQLTHPDPAVRDKALARLAIGTGLTYGVFELARGGLITGGGPADFAHKRALRETGWQEYSFLVSPDTVIGRAMGVDKATYISYRRADPFAMYVGITADMMDVWAYASEDERNLMASVFISSLSRNIASKTWAQGANDFFAAWDGAFSGNPAALENYLARLAPTAIPFAGGSAARWIAQSESVGGDPTRRVTRADPFNDNLTEATATAQFIERVVNEIRARTPGQGDGLPPLRNFWGEIQVRNPGFALNMAPFFREEPKFTPQQLERAGLPPVAWARMVHGPHGDMSDEQHLTFVQIAGINGELMRLSVPLRQHSRKIAGVELSSAELDRHILNVNQILPAERLLRLPNGQGLLVEATPMEQALNELITTEGYREASDDPELDSSKSDLIQAVIRFYRHRATPIDATQTDLAEMAAIQLKGAAYVTFAQPENARLRLIIEQRRLKAQGAFVQ